MTLNGADAQDTAYVHAWSGVVCVFLYYTAATMYLRWRPGRPVTTMYEPPEGVSPAIAAYLFENGRSERAFASALASLAVNGYLEIRQKQDWFTLKRVREPDSRLSTEESAAIRDLFPGGDTYRFDEKDNSRLCAAFRKFKQVVEQIAEPKLISSNQMIWWIGLITLLVVVISVALSLPFDTRGASLPSFAVVCVWIVLGFWALLAALRSWPATLRRVITWIPIRRGPRHPLSWIDLQPLSLTATVTLALVFLGTTASMRFAVLVLACFLIAFTFRTALKAPTKEGRNLLGQLRGFRDFLARAESDRLDRENDVGLTPKQLERCTPYAVALDVEHSWGEEFAEDLLEITQFNRVLELHDLPSPVSTRAAEDDSELGDSIIQLRLGSRK
jgi:hypothetical protein